MYGTILRKLREARGRTQADVAKAVGISPAHLARLETSQRGLYVEDFVSIAQALDEKPGNLLPNDLGDIGHLKPLIDRLATISPEHLPRVTAIVGKIVSLTEEVAASTHTVVSKSERTRRAKPTAGTRRKGR
jgi:transcriptional regulator with XRE-family HTH domain